MSTLVTKAQIIARAFTRQVSESRIPEDIIYSCQRKYIKPILGTDFYNDVVANPSSYTDLINNYILPVLAWYVRYTVLPELRMELSDLGISTTNIKETSGVDADLFAQIRNNTLIVAEDQSKLLSEYLLENAATFNLYIHCQDPNSEVKIVGGIVMDQRPKRDRKWLTWLNYLSNE
jgi:hypothetical protein